MQMPRDMRLSFLRDMLRIRFFENAAIELWDSGRIRGSIHPYIGQEAIAVGVTHALQTEDYIVSTHRGHGHALAKGAKPAEMMAELLGKITGCCKGRGGSMHVADLRTRNLGANGLVAGGLGIGVGAALTSKLQKRGYVVVAFFGEGATNQGMFHESMNMASIWTLPIVFVCENNKYAVSTDCEYSIPVRNVSQRAKAYGMPGLTIDGNDVESVYETMNAYISRARAGEGPALIECKTYRWEGHYHGEPQVYRTKEEVEEWKKQCPILRLETRLREDGVSEEEIRNIKDIVEREIREAVRYAEQSPDPSADTVFEYVYAD